jgi:hypothetical protein
MEAARKSPDLAVHEIGRRLGADEGIEGRPILIARTRLALAGQNDASGASLERRDIVDIREVATEQQSKAAMTRERHGTIPDNAGARECTQRLAARHDDVGKDALVASDRDKGVAEPDAACQQRIDDHGLRQRDDKNPTWVDPARARPRAPGRKSIEDQRQQDRVMVAFAENRQLGAAVDRSYEVRKGVGEAVEVRGRPLGAERGPGNALCKAGTDDKRCGEAGDSEQGPASKIGMRRHH